MKTTVWLSAMICLMLLALCLTLASCNQNPPVGGEQTSAQDSGPEFSEVAFELNEAGDGYTVTGMGAFDGTELIIPTAYQDLPVKEIAAEAFKDCTQLKSVTLPENLHIGDYAFSGCTGLEHVTVPKGTTGLNYAFASCTGLKSATILFQRNTDSEEQPRIFENCSSLTDLEFGSDVYVCVESAFIGKIFVGTADADYYTDDYFISIYLETVHALDSDGNELLDKHGEPIRSHYNLFDPLPIVSVTGGILSYDSWLTSIPTVAKLENYTVDGECVNVDGVLLGRAVNHPDSEIAGMYTIWWIDPTLEVLDVTHFYPYLNIRVVPLDLFYRCNDLTTIKVDENYDENDLRSRELSGFKSLTDIYFDGSIVEYLEFGAKYYGDDSCTVHCSDGDISKELGAALMYTEAGGYSAYLSLYRIYSYFPADVAYMLEQYNGNAVPKGFDHVCGQDAWTRENEKAAKNNAQQNGEEYVEHICGYKHFLAIDASGAQYEAYAEYKDAQQGTKEYDLYQLYLSYRTAHSGFTTYKNRCINDLASMYRYNQTIGAAEKDVVPAIEEYVNVHLPLLAELYGCTIEYEQGKEGDLTAVTNLEQLPKLIKDDIQTFAALLQEGAPLTPAEAEQLYQEALAMILESGVVTQEEINDRLE